MVRASGRSRSCARAWCAAPSSTTCATCAARRAASPRTSRPSASWSPSRRKRRPSGRAARSSRRKSPGATAPCAPPGAARSRPAMAFRKKAAPPPPPPPRTLFEKIWDAHIVHRQDDGTCVIYIDRHLVHEVTSPQAFEGLRMAGRPVRRPDATIAVADHNTPTINISQGITDEESRIQVETLEKNVAEFGVPYFGMTDARRGIVHVIGPEQGLTLPGMTIVCGDSHTSTHGAFGALAFGIGTSEVEHVLATQCLRQRRPKTMAVTVDGTLPLGVTAKDVALGIIARIGVDGGRGHVIEYRGSTIRGLSMEGRMTVCNMTIEGGARAGLVAPDETTFAYVKGRPHAPRDGQWEKAVTRWKALATETDAQFDQEVSIDASRLEPYVSWGT